ncbi:DUF2484 family protein [Paracoccaceae bacterium Fryx2]|nr:DUF2484 family protein [Paracoccaceae bacterium Fryx2]
MTPALGVAFLWLIIANVIAMFPSRDQHWTSAYILIVVGIPILGWVTYDHGPIWGMAILAFGASVLRWPLIYLWRWIRAHVLPRKPQD